MVALGRLENGAGELGAHGTSKDTLDGIASTIVPQLHTKGELLRWGGRPITLQDFVPALAHTLKRTVRRLMLRRVRTGYNTIFVA